MFWQKCINFIVSHALGIREEEDGKEQTGHITSVAVLRSHRKLGLAERLMRQARMQSHHLAIYIILEAHMAQVYGASSVTLHVRRSNKAALHLYTNSLGFK